MKLKFVNDKYPKLASDLTNKEKNQLLICESLYFEMGYSIDKLFSHDDDGECFLDLELWDIVDENNELVYKIYTYNTDSGTLFKGNTTEVIGQVMQFGFECEDYEQEKTLGKQLHKAQEVNGPGNVQFLDDDD